MKYLILITAILLLTTILFAYLLYKSGKKNKVLENDLKTASKAIEDFIDIENEKTDIRNKQNEKENDIINNPKFDNGVMPINKTKKSGSYRDRGGKGSSSNS